MSLHGLLFYMRPFHMGGPVPTEKMSETSSENSRTLAAFRSSPTAPAHLKKQASGPGEAGGAPLLSPLHNAPTVEERCAWISGSFQRSPECMSYIDLFLKPSKCV